MARQPVFFDVDERYAALSAAGDPLERLAAVVDFEVFWPVLDAALGRSDRSRGGRPPYDAVLTFRVLVLQALYSLSDEQADFQLRDRLSFMRFAGLDLHQTVPDARTIWLYSEQLKQAGAIEGLFLRFDAVLVEQGYLAMGGQIIEATIIVAPRQKLTLEEKGIIPEGGTPEGWSRAKRAQKDRLCPHGVDEVFHLANGAVCFTFPQAVEIGAGGERTMCRLLVMTNRILQAIPRGAEEAPVKHVCSRRMRLNCVQS